MAQFLVIVRDTNQLPINNAQVSCGGITANTDTTGTVLLSITSVNGLALTVTVTAQGYESQTATVNTAQYTQTCTLLLPLIVSSSQSVVTVTNGSSVIPNANVFAAGSYVGKTDASGKILVSLTSLPSVVEVSIAGYQVSRIAVTSSIPDTVVLQPITNQNSQITVVSSPPGAPIQVAGESGVLSVDGTFTTVGFYPPGSYTVVLGSGANELVSSVTVS